MLVLLLALVATGSARAANGCFANWNDLRGRALVTVSSPNCQALDYQPRCARISAGTTVRFVLPGNGCHPTFGGRAANDGAIIDPASPIGPWSSGANEAVLAEVGEFPYFCDLHYRMGMSGSIDVVPELFKDSFEAPAVP